MGLIFPHYERKCVRTWRRTSKGVIEEYREEMEEKIPWNMFGNNPLPKGITEQVVRSTPNGQEIIRR